MPGAGLVTSVLGIELTDDGNWLAQVFTDAPGFQDTMLLLDGDVLWREGEAVPGQAGHVIKTFDHYRRNAQGDAAVLIDGEDGSGAFREYAFFNQTQLAILYEPVDVPGVSSEAVFSRIYNIETNDRKEVMLHDFLPGGAEGPAEALIRYELGEDGAIIGKGLFAIEDDVPVGSPGGLVFFEFDPRGQRQQGRRRAWIDRRRQRDERAHRTQCGEDCSAG